MDAGRRDLAVVVAVAAAIAIAGAVGWWAAARRSEPPAGTQGPVSPAPLPPHAPPREEDEPHDGMITTEEIRKQIADEAANADLHGENSGLPVAPADGPVTLSVKFVGGRAPDEVAVYATPDNGERVMLWLGKDAAEGHLPAAGAYDLRFWIDGWDSDQRIDDLVVPDNQRIEIEIGLPRQPSVRVVDATGRPLAQARAAFAPPWGRSMPAPHADARDSNLIEAGSDGRIPLETTAIGTDLWVGADGYAWTLVHVNPGDLDSRVALGRGGGLRVTVVGDADPDSLTVVAGLAAGNESDGTRALGWRAGVDGVTRPTLEFEVAGAALDFDDEPGRFKMDGLRPGRWRVAAFRSSDVLRFPTPFLGVRDIEVRAGEVSEVRLGLGEELPARDVALEVVVPPAWGAPESIVVSRENAERGKHLAYDPRTEGRGAPGLWRFNLKSLPEGPYVVDVVRFGYAEVVRVREDTESLRVVVPPPVSLRVRVVNEPSGDRVAGALIQVRSSVPLGDVSGPIFIDAETDASGECVLRVPPGPLVVMVEVRYRPVSERRITLAPTSDEVVKEFHTSLPGTLALRVLREGRVPVLPPWSYECLREASREGDIDGEREASDCVSSFNTHIDFVRTGRYRVRAFVPGYEKPLEALAKVKPEEETVVDLNLPAR